jgi:hypothetical protein
MIRFAADGAGAGGISNGGLIDAGDERVVLSAGSAAHALDAAINTTGVIRATGAGEGGRIEIAGRGAGRVRIGGTLGASGDERGGVVAATGSRVEIAPGRASRPTAGRVPAGSGSEAVLGAKARCVGPIS